MRNALLALRTVRYLRPIQIYGRLWFRLYRPAPDRRPAPAIRPPQLWWQGCSRSASLTGPDRFRFLSIERSVRGAAAWTQSDVPKLWLYHLHYFDDLLAEGAHARRRWHDRLMQRWIAENSPGQGVGWDAYPVSLRIVNWIQWALSGNSLCAEALDSLATQARWLRKRMEIHLLGNHLWANAKALIFAGLFFTGREAGIWRRKGLTTLRGQLTEQILTDGGHFERSPMYHAIVLADLLDLIQLTAAFPDVVDGQEVRTWRRAAAGMLRWMRVMTHPDGGIAFFNDAALGHAPSYVELYSYANRIGVSTPNNDLQAIEALPSSGYVRLQIGPAVLIADVGDIGPDYQPGHAHADTLSFELSLHGRRVIVNGGTSTYEPGTERMRQRGTAAHNTVVIDGKDSSEIWASFRVARRARPRAACWTNQRDGLCLQAAHDGYCRLSTGLTHARRWHLSESCLVIEDTIGGVPGSADAMILLNPMVKLESEQDAAELRWDDNRATIRVENAVMSAEHGTWHPRFGESLPSVRLRLRARARQFRALISW